MADPSLPHALAMRELKYGAASAADKDRVAQLLVSLGRHSQALLLYEGRPDAAERAGLRDQAVTAGAAFRLVSIKRQGGSVAAADLVACAQAAERAGRYLDARTCYVALGDQAALERIAEHLPPSLRPPPPAAPPATSTSH